MRRIETVVIGAGQAGLAMSYYLGRIDREHLVVERGRVAERWRSERWDSLTFQFPNWMVRLPGFAYEGSEPEGFMPRDSVVAFVEEYAKRIAAPIHQGMAVTKLSVARSGRLQVQTDRVVIDASNVVVATGAYQAPRTPAFGAALPAGICQLPANRYRNPDQFPPGGVLIVGAGGSGCQIAEDLLRSGRRLFLSVGRHRRVPRRYRGRDFGWWQEKTGAADCIVDTLHPPPQPPLLTGVDGGHDVDLRELARRGVTLLGSLGDVRDGRAYLVGDLAENLARGDEAFEEFARSVDRYILAHGIEAPPQELAQPSRGSASGADAPLRELDIGRNGIGSVIWATGYRCDFAWIDCPVFDSKGMPIHRRGVTKVPGLYFLGLPRLHKLKSAFLWGVGEDAAYLAEHIASRRWDTCK